MSPNHPRIPPEYSLTAQTEHKVVTRTFPQESKNLWRRRGRRSAPKSSGIICAQLGRPGPLLDRAEAGGTSLPSTRCQVRSRLAVLLCPAASGASTFNVATPSPAGCSDHETSGGLSQNYFRSLRGAGYAPNWRQPNQGVEQHRRCINIDDASSIGC